MNIIHNYNVLCIHFIMHKHPWNDEEEGVGMTVPNGQGAIREVCLQRTVSLGGECTQWSKSELYTFVLYMYIQ